MRCFEHDFDTCIVIIGEMVDPRFAYVQEELIERLTDTVEAIKERLLLPKKSIFLRCFFFVLLPF